MFHRLFLTPGEVHQLRPRAVTSPGLPAETTIAIEGDSVCL